MDSFTENILVRARERQRLLQGDHISDKLIPHQEHSNGSTSEPNLTAASTVFARNVRSETDISCSMANTEKVESNSSDVSGAFIRQNSITRICSALQGSPGKQTKTLNIQRDSFNMEIKVNSADNVRVEVEIEEREENKHENEENSGLREESRNRLKRLGRLYAGGDEADISSPIHRTEAKFYESIEDDKENSASSMKAKRGLSRLANLADTINQWEDDLSHHYRPTENKSNTPKRSCKSPAPNPPLEKLYYSPSKNTPTISLKSKAPTPPGFALSSPKKDIFSQSKQCSENSSTKTFQTSPKKQLASNTGLGEKTETQDRNDFKTKRVNWDKKVLDALESQGFTRTQSSSRLVCSYNEEVPTKYKADSDTQIEQMKLESRIVETPSYKSKNLNANATKVVVPVKKTVTTESSSKNFKSGAIANRAAMFEQKVIETGPTKPERDPALLSLADRKALFEKNKGEALIPKAAFGMSAPVKVDTTMKACQSKFIGAKTNKENSDHQPKKSTFETNKSIGESQNKTVRTKYPAPPPPMVQNKTNHSSTSNILDQSKSQHATVPTVAVVHQDGGIASKMAALLENKNKSTISEMQIANKVKEERQKELDMLLNRFNKNKEISYKGDEIQEVYSDQSESDAETDERTFMLKRRDDNCPMIVSNINPRKSAEKRKSGSRLSSEADSPHVVSVLDEVKRIKVTQPKVGRLYPNLSDIEATTTDQDTRTPTPNEENSYEDNSHCDSDDPNTSFGRDILETVCKNITPKKVTYKDSSSSSENSSVMEELDEILEEMEDDNCSLGPTPPKQGRHLSAKNKKPQTSNSFHYKSFTSTSSDTAPEPKSKFQSPKKSVISPRQSTELPMVVEGEQILPLTHTVSFYRRQQNEVHTPVRQITRQPIIEEAIETTEVESDEVQSKITHLQEEVNKQQNIISQTSQALNLCSSTPEFSGSTEQVEAEKVLLVATHRRQAALHELQRLRVERTIRPLSEHSQNVPLEKGTLTISNIILPMKQKYVTALAAAGGKGHHVVCLIKCGEQVVPTKLVSTVASNSKNPDVDLYINDSVTLNNIYSDFTVTFEVYCLQAQEECLPHEIKYHINKKSSKGSLTPKKSKQDSRLLRPRKESPAGPQAVRTSSFALMGYVVFSVQAVNKRVWSLNNTPSMSPLEGSVEMKIKCELAVSVEHRGFLTMFEDVSGFGAWHRRWCLLKGQTLSYWKYPEDEKKMAPIDTIDLKTCITKKVGPVSRDICARLHTFLLERERSAYPQDKDTLVIVRKGDKTIIRHLLSADTKDERVEWCSKLNASLTALRMWGNEGQ